MLSKQQKRKIDIKFYTITKITIEDEERWIFHIRKASHDLSKEQVLIFNLHNLPKE